MKTDCPFLRILIIAPPFFDFLPFSQRGSGISKSMCLEEYAE
jgi:hypothetical protein